MVQVLSSGKEEVLADKLVILKELAVDAIGMDELTQVHR
jgi:hypothetical protein